MAQRFLEAAPRPCSSRGASAPGCCRDGGGVPHKSTSAWGLVPVTSEGRSVPNPREVSSWPRVLGARETGPSLHPPAPPGHPEPSPQGPFPRNSVPVCFGVRLAQRQLKINGLGAGARGWEGVPPKWCLLVFQFWVPRGLCTVSVGSFVPSAPPTGLSLGLKGAAAVGSPVGQRGGGSWGCCGQRGPGLLQAQGDEGTLAPWPSPRGPSALGKATFGGCGPQPSESPRGQEGRGQEEGPRPSITPEAGSAGPSRRSCPARELFACKRCQVRGCDRHAGRPARMTGIELWSPGN